MVFDHFEMFGRIRQCWLVFDLTQDTSGFNESQGERRLGGVVDVTDPFSEFSLILDALEQEVRSLPLQRDDSAEVGPELGRAAGK
jgi:hypothetical protein